MHEAESPGASTPTDIELDARARKLRIAGADGRRSEFEGEYLRWRCPCATCSGEGEFAGVLKTKTSMSPDEIEMTDAELVGRYALKPTWRDGHDTGIFTFRSLRALANQDNLLE